MINHVSFINRTFERAERQRREKNNKGKSTEVLDEEDRSLVNVPDELLKGRNVNFTA